jgi:hypothetical protein
MKRKDILSEMKAALSRYRTIEEDQFYFGVFVNKYDAANNCGTICCLWGWEPKFDVLPVEWINNKNFIGISEEPIKVLNWGKILNYLYYPSNENHFICSFIALCLMPKRFRKKAASYK